MQSVKVGFLGAGGIARAHAYSLNSLKYFYPEPPDIKLSAVASAREASRLTFAEKFGFSSALSVEEFMSHSAIDTVFILGPNKVHYPQLEAVLNMPQIKRIYIEKPVCSSYEEEKKIGMMVENSPGGVKVQVGFQFLMGSAIREAIRCWRDNDFGSPIHFSFTMKHSDYLQRSYRDKRRTRLTNAPDGGAMADLGSHAVSLMVAFLGEGFQIRSAMQSGSYEDVPAGSDLYSEISLFHPESGAVGNLSASRISSGNGDVLAFEIYGDKGAIKYNSFFPDRFEYFFNDTGDWSTRFTGIGFDPLASFPGKHVPPGWLRSLIHAHYVFLTDDDKFAFVPDLGHGLEVQRLVRETSEQLKLFRENTGIYVHKTDKLV